MATRSPARTHTKARYSVETISRQVAIETESGGRIILTDPEVEAVEFISWGDAITLGKKLLDLIKTSPTFPTPPPDDGDGGDGPDITIIISGGTDITITIPR